MGKEVLKSWITNGTKKPFYARKSFTTGAKAKAAKVTVCGLGQFNLYVNGKKAGDHYLDPAWTDYRKHIMYLEFDVTDLMVTGENVVAAEVGNGWYIMEDEGEGYSFDFPDFMKPNPNPYIPFNDCLILGLTLEAELEDGSFVTVITDGTWKTHEHMVEISKVYGSERINGGKRILNWNAAGCDEGDWDNAQFLPPEKEPKVPLKLQTIPSVRQIGEYDAKLLHHVNNRDIYDFSQNASGILSFDVKGKKGDIIRIFPAEKLGPDGDVDQMAKNWMMIDVVDSYVIGEDDTWEHFELTFTFICARFLAVTCDALQIKNIKLKAISSAFEKAGTFECDDERFIQIYNMIERAVESNMLGIHSDCPTIERFAWQEENHLTAPFVMFMKQVKPHWAKFLEDSRMAQHTADDCFFDREGGRFYPGEGLIPSQAPCYIPNALPVPGIGSFYDIISWGSTIILGTNWHYEFYGDAAIIEENYHAAKRYFEHLKNIVTGEGFISSGLGDWGNPAGMMAKENIETAFLYGDAKVMEKFANILGKADDAAAYTAYAAKVKSNYNEKLLVYNVETKAYCYKVWDHKDKIATTPACEALPLYWGLCPEEHEADVAAALKQAVISGGSFQSGEVGQPYIIQTMSKYGMNDLICKVILADQHPSYYAFVLAGETSLGEYWEDNPRSHCHDMMGHIAEWYYNGIAGIKSLAPGFKKILVKPYLPESMSTMKCTYNSASGPITVKMKRENGEIRLDVQAAKGIEVTIDRSFLD